MLASWLGLGPAQEAVADQPGKILNVWPLPGGGPGTGEAFRILYRSTGINGEPIQVSAAIFIHPSAAPKGGRNVIAWAHPTTGVARACAVAHAGRLEHDLGLAQYARQELRRRRHGLSGPRHAGRSSLPHRGQRRTRGARFGARRPRPSTHGRLEPPRRLGPWPGRHAALYTGELAKSYAPELKLVGTAAAAPDTYLMELFRGDQARAGGKELTAMALYSWSRLYNKPASTIVTPQATPPTRRSRATASSPSPSSSPSTRRKSRSTA
jgi:hypothetical protein